MAKVVTDERAKAGRTGRPVLYVLVASIVIAIVAMGSFVVLSGRGTPPTGGEAQAPASSSSTSRTPADNPSYPAPAQRQN